jgi:hypothetical protein
MQSPQPFRMPLLLICFGIISLSAAFVLVMSKEVVFAQKRSVAAAAAADEKPSEQEEDASSSVCDVPTISIAFCGNSMLYFNDCPRFMEQMITVGQSPVSVVQNSCLRGGATLTSLYQHGNGMSVKFATPPATYNLTEILSVSKNRTCTTSPDDELVHAKVDSATAGTTESYDIGADTVLDMLQSTSWDYVILNDYTQGPARMKSRKETLRTLIEKYVPLFGKNNNTTIVPIVVQTPAYKQAGLKDSEDLGDFISFTNRLAEGVKSYVDTLKQAGITESRVAPVGEAYRYLHNNDKQLWKRLYSWDHFHPSPYGTWLQACVIYCTMFDQCPPPYNETWWKYSRYMQPPDEKPLPKPTAEEAKELRRIACMITGVKIDDGTKEDDVVDESSG